MKYRLLTVLLLLVGASLLFMSMDGKKLKLKGTKWQYVEKMFVADAGTETTTYTLEFTTDKDVVKTRKTYMPPHPAMYMDANGEVPTQPGWESSSSEKGTYRVKRNVVSVTLEDGFTEMYDYKDGNLVSWRKSLSGENMTFSPCQE